MPRVTCFQHIDCEGPGSLWDVLKTNRVDLQVLKPFQGDPVPDHPGDGLIVLGGPMGVYEEAQFPWMSRELEAIRRCLAQSIPVLGICLGSQMLAHAAGGQVYRGALPEVGWYPIEPTPSGRLDPLLLGLPEKFEALHWHGDTFALPPGAKLLASSARYQNQIFKIGSNAYGFQCHLEVTEEMVRSWAGIYAKDLTPSGGATKPERVEEGLTENITALRNLSEKVFTRFAALL